MARAIAPDMTAGEVANGIKKKAVKTPEQQSGAYISIIRQAFQC
jgi:hypothetical protein